MKTRLKQWFTTIPGIILLFTGVAFMILDVLQKVDFDIWHMATFMGVGMFLIFGSTADFKSFGNAIIKMISKK
jgi:hypothetical protein